MSRRITSSRQTVGPSTASVRPVSSTISRAAASSSVSPSSTPPPIEYQNDGPPSAPGRRPFISRIRPSGSSSSTLAVSRSRIRLPPQPGLHGRLRRLVSYPRPRHFRDSLLQIAPHRLLGFAFAIADLLIEVAPNGKITFAVGAAAV